MTDVESVAAVRTGRATDSARKPRASSQAESTSTLVATASRRRAVAMAFLWVALGVCAGGGGMWLRGKARDREVVASVNGDVITKDAFYRRLEQAAGAQVIRQIVGESLQMQFARKAGAAPTEADVERRYAEIATEPEFAQGLARTGRTPDDVKRELRVALARIGTLGRGVEVSEAEIRRFYEVNAYPRNPGARYYQPETAQVAVIATATKADAAKAQADLNHGIPWATVARTQSRHASRTNGGQLPPLARGRMTDGGRLPGFEAAVFGTPIGRTIGPRQFAGAWWLVRVLDRKPAVTQPFAKVRDEARLGALLAKALPSNTARVQADFERFQKQASINAFWTQYRDAVSAQ